MDPGLDSPYGSFRAPRLPLDLRCITMGALGWGTLQLADWALGKAFGQAQPIAQVMGLLREQVGHIAFLGTAFDQSMGSIWGTAEYELAWSQAFVTSLVFLGVWAVFGGALLRIAALRLTRNEALGPRAALGFGLRMAPTMLAVPVLVLAFIAVLAGLNALAGLVMSIPLVGSSILTLVLMPLTLLSSLLLVMALVGGVLGLPLMWCGVMVERNGALEAVSRAFSYVSARPIHFFFSYLLIFVLVSAVTLLGGYVEQATKISLQAGVVRTSLDEAISKPAPEVDVLEAATRDNERVVQREKGIRDIRNIREVAWYDKPGFICKGYALYIFLGGTMSMYLMLRREVDGTHEDELAQIEDEENGPGARARWVGESEKKPAPEAPTGSPVDSREEPPSETTPDADSEESGKADS